MTLEQEILEAVRALPADKQRELMDHVQRFRGEATQLRKPRKSGRGGWDGIRYRSKLGKGNSFALFDLESAELINCTLFETKAISFQFDHAGNSYSVRKHFPELNS